MRDVPLRDPTFGDVGQVYDPWVYLGWIAAQTSTIALATGSIVLTLRHPLHTAKAAASVDRLSGGRLVLGVASGDRPVEFPAFGVDYDGRDAVFRENLRVIREVLAVEFPRVRSSSGTLSGAVDLIPKPAGRLPILVTGSSRQDLDWIAEHSDGWITYPRPVGRQAELAARWRAAVASAAPGAFKPFAQSLYLDLVEDPGGPPEPLHLGFRAGRDDVLRYLEGLRAAGVHHVGLNFKYAAPFPDLPTFTVPPPGTGPPFLLNVLAAALAGVVNQARFDPKFAIEERDPEAFHRFMIAPRRDAPPPEARTRTIWPAARSAGSAGSSVEDFRAHDFQLGRRNCQQFLNERLRAAGRGGKQEPAVRHGLDRGGAGPLPDRGGARWPGTPPGEGTARGTRSTCQSSRCGGRRPRRSP